MARKITPPGAPKKGEKVSRIIYGMPRRNLRADFDDAGKKITWAPEKVKKVRGFIYGMPRNLSADFDDAGKKITWAPEKRTVRTRLILIGRKFRTNLNNDFNNCSK